MTKYEAEQLIGTINRLIAGPALERGAPLDRVVAAAPMKANGEQWSGGPIGGGHLHKMGSDATAEEALYQRFKRRLIDEAKTDPILVQLLLTQPEIHVGIEHRRIELSESNLKGRLAKLAARGFFEEPRIQADAARELKRTGAEAHSGRLSEAFAALVLDGVLTREDNGFRLAPGVTVTEKDLTS